MVEFSVATANTQSGNALRSPKALESIVGTDVWLLQEVNTKRDIEFESVIHTAGMRIAACADEFGLAIAVRKNIDVITDNKIVLQEQRRPSLPCVDEVRYRARGILQTEVVIGGMVCTLATVHPIVPIKFLSRASQLKKIPEAIDSIKTPLIMGGDMNHFPRPRPADAVMQHQANLSRVDIGKQPTWHAIKSNQKVAAFVLEGVAYNCGVNWRYAAQLDSMYYRNLSGKIHCTDSRVVQIDSDHDAIIASFLVSCDRD